MRRNMDMVRAILLAVEEKPSPAVTKMRDIIVENYEDSSERRKHFVMMASAGFFDFEASRSKTNSDRIIDVLVLDLSWRGHDYLDSIRDPKIWKATKGKLDKIGGASFEMVLEIAKAIAKQNLKRIGLDI